MRRLSITALLAAPFLVLADPGTARANPPMAAHFGCGGHCFKMFPFIHQHGPLFNYGPYYGYYPFAPYGPWDAYLRFDPFFYGDPSAAGDIYGKNPRLRHSGHLLHNGDCSSCGFFHASWAQGGWFRGHKWLDGGHGCCPQPECTPCAGVSVPQPQAPTADPAKKYTGIGTPSQSAVYYGATPTLDPRLGTGPALRTK